MTGDLRQLPLGVRIRDAATLEAFEPGPNAAALQWLRTRLGRVDPASGPAASPAMGERGWFWGPTASGRSHLLEAACRSVVDGGASAMYLTPEVIAAAPEAVLEGLEHCALVALDDVDGLAGRPEAEAALFDLANRTQAAGTLLLASASGAPLTCGWGLPDLASRFAAATVFRLRPLDDEGRVLALRRRARVRGIDLDLRTARYVLTRFSRDPRALFALLDDLDEASLSAQRRVTVPFVRDLLAARSAS